MKKKVLNIPNPSGLNELTKIERKYWMLMQAQSGVPYIQGKPGFAKSAIFSSIAKKLGMEYVYFPLATTDEVDLGVFPSKKTIEYEGKQREVQYTLTPEWAVKANQKPTILVFEEINRAPASVRNAALFILNERGLGYSGFKFNDNVFMVSAGNLGEEDNTEVDEMDAAMMTRLIHVRHNMTLEDWKEGYANENIHPLILEFLTRNPAQMDTSNNKKNSDSTFANPRTWTFLSDAIVSLFCEVDDNGKLVDMGNNDDIAEFVANNGSSYIGAAANIEFLKFIRDAVKFNYIDVLDSFDSKVKNHMTDFNRAVIESVINDMTRELTNTKGEHEYIKLSEKQRKNFFKFIEFLDQDHVVAITVKLLNHSFLYLDATLHKSGKENNPYSKMTDEIVANITSNKKYADSFSHLKKTLGKKTE
jgi:hypothetical protein